MQALLTTPTANLQVLAIATSHTSAKAMTSHFRVNTLKWPIKAQCNLASCDSLSLLSLLLILVQPSFSYQSPNPPGMLPSRGLLPLLGSLPQGLACLALSLSSGHCHARCHLFSESLPWLLLSKLFSTCKMGIIPPISQSCCDSPVSDSKRYVRTIELLASLLLNPSPPLCLVSS